MDTIQAQDVSALMAEIKRVLPDGGEWCSVEKAQTLAAMIIANRPTRVVEIGVWQGGSLIPILLAMKHVRVGVGIAIDAWSADASVVGQHGENEAWWKSVDHDAAYGVFMARIAKHELEPWCRVIRKRSSDVTEQEIAQIGPIGLLHVDGNHGPQAVADVARFTENMAIGSYLVVDDVNWEGGHVADAVVRARDIGFAMRYPLGTGVVMQRVAHRPTFDFGGGV